MARKKKSHHGLLKMSALSAAALGAYYLYGAKDAKKNQKKVRGWALRAKGEVLETIEKLEGVDEQKYDQVVDRVSTKYKKLKHVNNSELLALANELKGHWREFAKEAGVSAKKPKRKPAKKTTTKKKVAKRKK
jgi:gamma-glutamylcyclotransferase (GGCT)/AIG2-like uncharacterized protein YtfP